MSTTAETDRTGGVRNVAVQGEIFPSPGLTGRALQALRVHEAGHAVVLTAEGGRVEKVVCDLEAGGGVYGREWTPTAELAGIAAERVGGFSARHPGALTKTMLRAAGWGSDLRGYRRCLRLADREGRLRSDLEKAEAAVRARWAAVKRVAAALGERGRLAGEEVRELIEARGALRDG